MKRGYPQEEGPFICRLDEALKDFNVARQAYYGGTFVSNRVRVPAGCGTAEGEKSFTGKVYSTLVKVARYGETEAYTVNKHTFTLH